MSFIVHVAAFPWQVSLAYLPASNFPAAVCTMSSPAMAFATLPTMASTGTVHGNLSLTAPAKHSRGFGKSIQLPVAEF